MSDLLKINRTPEYKETFRFYNEYRPDPQWAKDLSEFDGLRGAGLIETGLAPESVPPYSPMLDFILAPPRNRAERREQEHGHFMATSAYQEEVRQKRFGTLGVRSGGWERGGYRPRGGGKTRPRPLGKTKKGSYRKV